MLPAVSSAFVILAKAGGSSEGAENTLSAIGSALAVSPPGWARLAIEVDVRLSADGVLVAHHDATLERTTNGSGLVRAHSLERLRELRAGPGGEPIPRLEEVYERVGDHELVVEVHDSAPIVAHELVRTLARLPPAARQQLILASEHAGVVRALRDLDPALRTAATAPEAWRKLLLGRLRLERWAPRGHVWIVPAQHRGMQVVTRRFAESAARAGDDVWVFVVDDAQQVLRLRHLGASGCFTTRPRALCAALQGVAGPAPG
jgi:glycerophosphoryl diester phosphodiesterase